MRALLFMLLAAAAGCAAFDEPLVHKGETVCIVGTCKGLGHIMKDLNDPAFNERVQASRPGEPL